MKELQDLIEKVERMQKHFCAFCCCKGDPHHPWCQDVTDALVEVKKWSVVNR